jgi:hypothetical protein
VSRRAASVCRPGNPSSDRGQLQAERLEDWLGIHLSWNEGFTLVRSERCNR